MGFFKNMNNRIACVVDHPTFLYYVYIWLDYFLCAIVFGVTTVEYFGFGYYNKSFPEKYRNFSRRKRNNIVKKCCKNLDAVHLTFTDKISFNELFSEFLKRDWMVLSKSDFDTVLNFVKEHNEVIIKKNWLCEGQGVEKFIYTNDDEVKNMYDKHYNDSTNDTILEECIVQHHEMTEFSKSVNTIRVITLLDNGKPFIISCGLRLGVGDSIIDNYDSGGIACDVDPLTGIVTSYAKNLKGDKFYVHPTSGKQIIGFKIPNWNVAIKLVKETALVYPDAGWVGWDIAITEDGALIVEGNALSGAGIFQIDSFGKYGMVKRIMAKHSLDI